MKYRCIKNFCVTVCDGDGFFTDEEMVIEAETIWIDEGDIIISSGEIHLISQDKNHSWIEIYREDLDKFFEPIK